jgi:hypothetical protein
MPFNFEAFIWPEAILRWIQQRSNTKFCADLGKSVADNLGMIRQVFGEESMSRTRIVQTHQDRKHEAGKEHVMSMLIIFFDIKGIVHK